MLNSDDLEQLKIQALLQNSKNNYSVKSFTDISGAFPSTSVDNVIVRSGCNANIMAFCYVLLAHIFDAHAYASSSSSSNASPQSQSNNGSGSKTINPERTYINNQFSKTKSKDKDRQQLNFPKIKLNRMYNFLFNSKINLSDIFNTPQNLQKLLKSVLKFPAATFNINTNIYLKKIIIQFLRILKQNCISSPRPNGNNGEKYAKISYISNMFQKYPISQVLMAIYMRSILYFQYQITDALDFNRNISDQTVYTALCDAFDYTSLKIQQNYTEIAFGSFIRFLRKKGTQLNVFYLVSLPKLKYEYLNSKDVQQIDTFRIRRKSSDQISNNQSVSFRQNQKQSSQKLNSNHKVKPQDQHKFSQAEKISKNKNHGQFPNQIEKGILSQNQIINSKMINNYSQTSEQRKFNNKQKQRQMGITKPFYKTNSQNNLGNIMNKPISMGHGQLNGYTSVELLKYLNPNVRQSMMKTINHFKQLHA